MGRRLAPPPERVSWTDYYRLALGGLMIVLGIAILVRAALAGVITSASVLMGLVFVAFGSYRLYVGAVRFRLYRQRRPLASGRHGGRQP